MGAFRLFLIALERLVRTGGIKKIEQAIKFAENQFGKISKDGLFRKQIENVFKKAKKPTVGTPTKKEATVSPIREGIETLADKKVLDKLDDVNLSADDPLGDLEKIVKGEGDTGLPKVKSDDGKGIKAKKYYRTNDNLYWTCGYNISQQHTSSNCC